MQYTCCHVRCLLKILVDTKNLNKKLRLFQLVNKQKLTALSTLASVINAVHHLNELPCQNKVNKTRK